MCWEKRTDHPDGLKCKAVERLFRAKEEKAARGEALMKVEQRRQTSGGRKKVADEWIGQANGAESNRYGETKRPIDVDVTGEKLVTKIRVAVKTEAIASKLQTKEKWKLVEAQSQTFN